MPLEDSEQESMGHIMANAIYSCGCVPYFRDDITKEQADRVWEQCLIDARRMVSDEDYERIFIE